MRSVTLFTLPCLGIPLLAAALQAVPQERQGVESSSRDRQLSQPLYPDTLRQSFYVTVRDGKRLAADIFRPAKGGEPHLEPLPLVWAHDRYHRSMLDEGRLVTKMENPTLRELVRRGYIVAAVDVRGAGASFGTYKGPFHPQEMQDAYDVTEWFAAQSWCSGKIGMYGGSYLGTTQYMAAATAPPHLRAIIPFVAPVDLYALAYSGGVFRHDFIDGWSALTRRLDVEIEPAPVAGSEGATLLEAARREHQQNRLTAEQARATPYRDSVDPELGLEFYHACSPFSYLEAISASGVAVYHIAGWFDAFPRDALVLYANLENPQRLAIGPWSHQQMHEYDALGEHLKWYDYWLKGIDNGVANEPPIHYYTMSHQARGEWRSAWEWPLPEERRTRYYFHASARGEPAGGALSTQSPEMGAPSVTYPVDFTTTSGKATRWTNLYGGPFGYPSMAANDSKAIGFTTAPLATDIEVTGHPVVEFWVQSTAADGDFFVYLEEVGAGGVSHYLTEGVLRASHRARSDPPYHFFELPYHRSFAGDARPLGSEPVELVLDLLPTSNVFNAGNRIRVTITGADIDNALTPVPSPPPVVTLLCDRVHPSAIVLPVIPHDGEDGK
ncbi:MAG: CocE/NonD family hydrolase [Planctomycetota bacterium]